jgi:hypothetical protein
MFDQYRHDRLGYERARASSDDLFQSESRSANGRCTADIIQIHALFGYALIAAGTLRIVEVCFVLNDQPTPNGVIRVFQHLPPYVSYTPADHQ